MRQDAVSFGQPFMSSRKWSRSFPPTTATPKSRFSSPNMPFLQKPSSSCARAELAAKHAGMDIRAAALARPRLPATVVPSLEPLRHLCLVLLAPCRIARAGRADVGPDQRVAFVAGVFERLVGVVALPR